MMIHKGQVYPNCQFIGKSECGRGAVFVTARKDLVECKNCKKLMKK